MCYKCMQQPCLLRKDLQYVSYNIRGRSWQLNLEHVLYNHNSVLNTLGDKNCMLEGSRL